MNCQEELKKIKKYYSNLLIIQYHDKPKAKATIELLAGLIYANMVLLQIQDGFNWKTALSAQLDIIGEWIGADKFYNGQLFDFRPWFSLIDWNTEGDNLQRGFSTFETFETLEGGFLDYENINPTQNILPKEVFRTLIGLKIIKNSINHTAKTIDEVIWNYFKGQVYTIWNLEQGWLEYYYPSDLNGLMQAAAQKEVLPCPTKMTIQLREIIQNA